LKYVQQDEYLVQVLDDDLGQLAHKIEQAKERKGAGIIEQEARADPEGGFPDKIDRRSLLEKFPEIINTGGYDQQAAEGVGHALEYGGGLDQKEIDE
jgi:hypothetical protein